MKKLIFLLSAAAALAACSKNNVKETINISSPTPSEQITKVTLSETQQGYMEAGNAMAFRFLEKVYDGNDFIVSPLSLQYALAMTANGATGETLQEIIDFLGYGEDGITALNAYCRSLLEQLPAVDLDVTLKLTDAILVNDQFPLLDSFQKTVRENYYAAVENMDFSNHSQVAATVNDWASRSTNGFIDKVLEASEISDMAVAYIMNALYFKAKWAGSDYNPMFRDYATRDETFTLSDGSTRQIPMMNNMRYHQYAQMDGYKVLALPYSGSKFFMYILLPDENNLDGLVSKLKGSSWNSILGNLKTDAEVYVKLPKFDIENKFNLTDALKDLGVKKAFASGEAQFDSMLQPKPGWFYWIEKVIQKARISVSEWGTEAAAVTVVEMAGNSAVDFEEPKRIYFYADHPFIFLIGESTSGAILFEGAYTGKAAQ